MPAWYSKRSCKVTISLRATEQQPHLNLSKEYYMRSIIYHVAVTLDGYIAHPDHSAKGFSFEGPHVTAFLEHLKAYDTVIMGRGTYEAGYQYGLKPGEIPYPTMRNYVFSQSLAIADNDRLKIVRSQWLDTVDMLKSESGSDIYLCGGGKLAGSLLAEARVDRLRLKVAPVVFGSGIKLFEGQNMLKNFRLDAVVDYGNGVLLTEYSKA